MKPDSDFHRRRALDLVWLDRYVFFDLALMRPGPAILDVGGMTRERMETIQRILPGASIVTCEAGKAAYEELTRRPLPKSLVVRHVALAPARGVLDFHVFEHSAMSSLEPWHQRESCGAQPAVLAQTEHVPSRTLSQLIADHDLGIVDLLSLNCEGAELTALMEICLSHDLRTRVRQILVSFHCNPHHLEAYPLQIRDALIANLAQHYIVVPGERHCQYFLFVRSA